jgi:hypothetical protein
LIRMVAPPDPCLDLDGSDPADLPRKIARELSAGLAQSVKMRLAEPILLLESDELLDDLPHGDARFKTADPRLILSHREQKGRATQQAAAFHVFLDGPEKRQSQRGEQVQSRAEAGPFAGTQVIFVRHAPLDPQGDGSSLLPRLGERSEAAAQAAAVVVESEGEARAAAAFPLVDGDRRRALLDHGDRPTAGSATAGRFCPAFVLHAGGRRVKASASGSLQP